MINHKKIQVLPAREQVASILRSMILSGEVKKDEALRIDYICDMVGMSRTPVREAFQILATEGLVELRQNRGAIVKELSIKTIKDHYDMRILLETEALKRACDNMDNENLKKLESAYQDCQKAKSTANAEDYNLANEAFHIIIWEIAGNEKLKSILGLLWNGLSINKLFTVKQYAKVSQDEHKDIIKYIKQKEYIKAQECMRQHIIRSMDSMLVNLFPKKEEK